MPTPDALSRTPSTTSEGFSTLVAQWARLDGAAPALGDLSYRALAERGESAVSDHAPITVLDPAGGWDTIVTAIGALARGAVLIGPEAAAPKAETGDLVLPVQKADGSPALGRFPQSDLVRMGRSLAERFGLSRADRVWVNGPLTDPGTWLILAATLASGGQVCKTAEGATVAWLLQDGAVPEGGSLRLVHLRASRETLSKLQSDHPELTVVNGFALPQGGGLPVCSDPRDPPSTVPGTLGRPLNGMEVMIVDPRTGMDMLLYQTGEVWLRGPGVMAGYADGGAPFEPGRYLRTGVLGQLDSEGRLVLSRTEEDMLRLGLA